MAVVVPCVLCTESSPLQIFNPLLTPRMNKSNWGVSDTCVVKCYAKRNKSLSLLTQEFLIITNVINSTS